jgi:hypothetical protein
VLFRDALSAASMSALHGRLGQIRTNSGRNWETDARGVSSAAAAVRSGEGDQIQLSCVSLRGRVPTDQLRRVLPLLAGVTRMMSERLE